MLVSKRHLTQSEKHRRYVDGVGKVAQNTMLVHDSAFRFTECPQNLAQSRKLQYKFDEIEKQKNKSVAKINGEKHILKLKYKGLLKNEDCDREIEETFFLQPGFRFRRNGETRKIRDPRVMPDVEHKAPCRSLLSLAKSNSSNQSLGSQSSNGKSHKSKVSEKTTGSAHSTGEGDGPVKKPSKINVEKTIQEIERDLQRIKHDKDLISINRRIRDVRTSLSFVRAHANDYKPAIPFIAQDHQNMFSSAHHLSESPSGHVDGIKRLSKHYTKINCSACENRLKHDNEKTSSPEESSNKHVQRWQTAPRGVYVSQLEHNKNTRPAKSAKAVDKTQATNEFKATTSERRVSKSASNTGNVAQRKTGSQRGVKGQTPVKYKPTSVLDRFKASNMNPLQTKSENEVVDQPWKRQQRQHSNQCPMSSPNIVNGSGEQGEAGDIEKTDSNEDLMSRSSQQEEVKEDIGNKVTAFCSKIPEVKPSITTWRKSSGQLVTWKPNDLLRGTKSSQECKMTWAEYQQTKDISLEHELQFKLYQSSQEKPTGDPNSYEELAKCRYLREFKMRKNLPEK